jgi:hypothetical protein
MQQRSYRPLGLGVAPGGGVVAKVPPTKKRKPGHPEGKVYRREILA